MLLAGACNNRYLSDFPPKETGSEPSSQSPSPQTSDSSPPIESETGAPETGTEPTETLIETPSMRVLSLNLHCFKLEGTTFPSNDDRFAAIAAAIDAEAVDAIAAQEACVNSTEGSAVDRLSAALEAATGETWGSVWSETHPAWTGTPDEATEGVAIFTRGSDPVDPDELTYTVQGTLLRKALSATVSAGPGASVRLYSIHLEYDDADARLAQARETAAHALVHADPSTWAVLVAGDFNAIASDAPLLDAAGIGFQRLSEPSDPYGIEIDHVLAPLAAGLQPISARLAFDGLAEPAVSDHPAVLVSFEMGAPIPPTVTHLSAVHDAGYGHYLALRGDTAPLSWDLGWPAVNTAPDRWELVSHGWSSGTIAYKWLRDDTAWEQGDDHTADAGTTWDVTPSF